MFLKISSFVFHRIKLVIQAWKNMKTKIYFWVNYPFKCFEAGKNELSYFCLTINLEHKWDIKKKIYDVTKMVSLRFSLFILLYHYYFIYLFIWFLITLTFKVNDQFFSFQFPAAITPVFSFTWCFRNHSADIVLKETFIFWSMFITAVLPRIIWWKYSSKEEHLFEIEILCNIINVFFDQCNMSEKKHYKS